MSGKDQHDVPTPQSLATDTLAGTVLAGRYELVSPLGRGGAGHVYRAVQQPLGRPVAVKILRSDIEADARAVFGQRFLREAALAGRLQHPNVVTVHDFGVQEDGLCYVVMELLEGRTLHRAMRDGPMLPTEVARLGAALARGLRHAHTAGLVHRDVKPNNVMLVRDDDGREQPKLLDFGLVKQVVSDDDAMTMVGQYLGTPSYMAPEQARRSDVDGRADLYALGIVMYRALTGMLPFEGDHPLAIAVAHQADPVPPMSERAPGVVIAPQLEAIVRRCLEKRPEDRYADAGALADALEAWVAGSLALPPAAMRQEVTPRRPWRALIGTALAVGVGGLLVAVGVGGVALGFFGGRSVPGGLPPEPAPALPAPSEAAPVGSVEPRPAPSEPAPSEPAPSEPAPSEPAPTPAPAPSPAPSAPRSPSPAPSTAAPAPVATRPSSPLEPPSAPSSAPTAVRPAEPVEPLPPGVVEVDGVRFDAAHAARAVAFLNAATPDALVAAGVYERGVGLILQQRPFASITAFGQTTGIGVKTVEAIAAATRAP